MIDMDELCKGCTSYKKKCIKDLSDKPLNCPCGNCVVKVMCGEVCSLYIQCYEDELNRT